MKAVFFDLDGTLFYTLEDIKAAIDYAIAPYDGESVPLDDVRRYVGRGLRRALAQAIVEHCPPLEDEGEQELMQALMISYYEKHPVVHTYPYPGIAELLRSLKERGVMLGIISNKADGIVQQIVSALSPVSFDFVAGAVPGVPLKPDPSALLSALGRLSLSREDIVYVGDSPVDAETASRAEVRSVIVSYGFSSREELEGRGIEVGAENVSELGAALSRYL